MLKEIEITKKEAGGVLAGADENGLPCYCGTEGDGRCGTKPKSSLMYKWSDNPDDIVLI